MCPVRCQRLDPDSLLKGLLLLLFVVIVAVAWSPLLGVIAWGR